MKMMEMMVMLMMMITDKDYDTMRGKGRGLLVESRLTDLAWTGGSMGTSKRSWSTDLGDDDGDYDEVIMRMMTDLASIRTSKDPGQVILVMMMMMTTLKLVTNIGVRMRTMTDMVWTCGSVRTSKNASKTLVK